MLVGLGEALVAIGDIRAGRAAWEVALPTLDEIEPGEAARLRVRLSELDRSVAAAG